MTKLCYLCDETKPLSEFHLQARSADGHQARCKECARSEARRWYNENLDRARAKQRDWTARNHERKKARDRAYGRENPHIKRNGRYKYEFGITLAEFDEMVLAQGGVCAACKQPETAIYNGKVRNLCVDHDHETGRVRGLLCTCCNTALGLLGEDLDRIEALRHYLLTARPQLVEEVG